MDDRQNVHLDGGVLCARHVLPAWDLFGLLALVLEVAAGEAVAEQGDEVDFQRYLECRLPLCCHVGDDAMNGVYLRLHPAASN